jgi:hypothetical protein
VKHGLAIAVVAVLGARALAQVSDPVIAEQTFEQGRALLSQREYGAARAKFAESLSHEVAVGTLLNLAECDEQLGRPASALGFWRRAISLMPPDDRRRRQAQERAAVIEGRVACVTVSLSADAPVAAMVTLDGEVLAKEALGTEACLDPGPHTWSVDAPGHLARHEQLVLLAGERRWLALAPGTVSPADAPTSSPRADRTTKPPGHALRNGAIGLFATGLVLVLSGGLTTLGVSAEQDTIALRCPARMCDSIGYDAVQTARGFATASIVLWVAGGLSISSGTALWAVHIGRKRRAAR